MKNCLTVISLLVVSSVVSSSAFASTQILDSLKQQGVQSTTLNNADLAEIRGSAYDSYIAINASSATVLSGQPLPSVTVGTKSHNVTYKGWGSYSDHTAYNYIGSGYSPGTVGLASYGGGNYWVVGDKWLADTSSPPTSWNAANASLIEYHYQIVVPDSNGLPSSTTSSYAFRYTAWNRPISKFSW